MKSLVHTSVITILEFLTLKQYLEMYYKMMYNILYHFQNHGEKMLHILSYSLDIFNSIYFLNSLLLKI